MRRGEGRARWWGKDGKGKGKGVGEPSNILMGRTRSRMDEWTDGRADALLEAERYLVIRGVYGILLKHLL